VPRSVRAAALLALALPTGLAAQRPAVSPVLARVWQRDTTLTLWLFVRPGVDLERAAAAATRAGARVRLQSRWLHALGADVPTAALRRLAGEPLLRRIQAAGRWRRPPGPDPTALAAPGASAAGDTCPAGGDPAYGSSEMPYRQLDLRPLADAGYDGRGVRIVILDAGFNTVDPAFSGVTVTAQYDFVFGDSVVRDQPNDQPGAQFHGTAVWSLFAGTVPGRLRGVARGAAYLLAKTEDVRSETRIEEINYLHALEWADSIGVDIASSSLGYLRFDDGFTYSPADLNGHVAVTTVAAESAAAHGILVVTAAGNAGPGFRTLVTPGDADSIITAGAEDSLGNLAGFSSRGPTADGRLKPDLTAPGVAVCVLTGPNTVGRLSGTSFATPLIAAAAALLKQLYPRLGPGALRRALRAHASGHAAPDSLRGWGRPDVAASAVFAAGIRPLAPTGPALASITPDFSWSVDPPPSFATPVTFRLRVARDSGLKDLAVDTVTTATSYGLRRPLKPGRPLFWQVDATAATGATATTGPVGPLAVPPWATLTSFSAPGGTNTADAQPTLTWESPAVSLPPGPLRYDLFVRRAAVQFANFPEVSVAGLSDTAFHLPRPLERDAAYVWSLVVHAGGDTSLVRSQGVFMVVDGSVPPTTLLYQNFPNPFPSAGRDSTCLWFDLAAPTAVELAVLDLRGSAVRRFVPGPDFPAVLPAGRYGRSGPGGPTCDPRLMWDGRADDGRDLPAGVYLYKLRAGGVIQFRRIVFRGRGH
jgi:serine protease AprX